MRSILPATAALLCLPWLAEAQPVRATYEVHVAGMTVMQMDAVFDVSATGYQVETQMRTRGVAAAFGSGQQMARVRGDWAGMSATPSSYVSEGTWRGEARRIALDWRGGDPVVRALVPANTDREEVSDEHRRGTVDALSAVAMLSRSVAQTGRCEGRAPIFDGRRRSDISTRTHGREVLGNRGVAWQGEALRCGFEGRVIAGFLRDESRARAGAPQQGTAWIAVPFAGSPPIPVRIEMPSRWYGTATAVLMTAGPASAAQPRQ